MYYLALIPKDPTKEPVVASYENKPSSPDEENEYYSLAEGENEAIDKIVRILKDVIFPGRASGADITRYLELVDLYKEEIRKNLDAKEALISKRDIS